jgi:3-hydroxyacyl-CoA dehydrogenase/enoyl-CoA hydratase/3-hydroxybutyryl-CoA epimerase
LHGGLKSGEGLYHWHQGKASKPPLPDHVEPDPDLQDRLMLPMVNEAVAILREGIVADEDLIDAGTIFGTGFAPFRGGPLRYARDRGAGAVYKRLAELATRHGSRFRPDAGWEPFLRQPL